ncbi:MAG: cytochrome c3 family protein [Gemmatimonadales bacterium]
MKTRRLIAAGLLVPPVVVLGIAVSGSRAQQAPQVTATAFEAPVEVDTASLKGPRQPIFFRHDVHAGQYEIDCQYCHVNAEISPKPGIPTLYTCMNCHSIVAGTQESEKAEIQKFKQAYSEGTPIEWIEVHELPPFVHFPHMIHVNAKEKYDFDCTQCHGQVDREPQVYQYSSLKMGWCLDCHLKNEVTTDCTACHF